MRRILLGLALILVALPAWAQTRDENRTNCDSADPDVSIAGCTALIQSGKETSDARALWYNNRGVAYEKKGLHDQAIADYTAAIKLSSHVGQYYNNRGTAYEAKDLHDQAIADFTKAIARDPEGQFYIHRGQAYEKKGRRRKAIADYRKALKFNGDNNDAREGLKRLSTH